MSKFAILLNGPIRVTNRLMGQVRNLRTIAADGGIVHAKSLGLEVELWVGDFDSTSQALSRSFDAVPRLQFPVAKDKTDGELAVDSAIERGARSLVFVGGLGGQSDHAFAHLTLAVRLAQLGLHVFITTGDEEAYPVLPGEFRGDFPRGTRLSVIALTDLEGLSLEGTKWPLSGANVRVGNTITMSNIVTGAVAIKLRAGYGIVIAYPAADAPNR